METPNLDRLIRECDENVIDAMEVSGIAAAGGELATLKYLAYHCERLAAWAMQASTRRHCWREEKHPGHTYTPEQCETGTIEHPYTPETHPALKGDGNGKR